MWDQLSWILSSLVQVSTKALWIQLRVMLLITIITWAPRWGSNSAQMLRISNQQWMKNSQRRWRHHHSWSMTHSRKDRPDDRDHVTPIISQSHLRFKAVFTISINTILIHIFPILHKRFNLLSVCCRNKTLSSSQWATSSKSHQNTKGGNICVFVIAHSSSPVFSSPTCSLSQMLHQPFRRRLKTEHPKHSKRKKEKQVTNSTAALLCSILVLHQPRDSWLDVFASHKLNLLLLWGPFDKLQLQPAVEESLKK